MRAEQPGNNAGTKKAWFDSLPLGWTYGSLRWLADIYAGGTPDRSRAEYWFEGNIPWLNSGSVNQHLITQPSAFITEAAFSGSSTRWVPAGALVMALAGQGKTKGTVAQMAIDAACNQSMAAIRPKAPMSARYLYWWLVSNYQNIRNMAGGDDRDGLNLSHLGDIICPVPSEEEQEAISAFLDCESSKIDGLVEEQRRLVGLLKEKRQAVIAHIITKGLNQSAQMKDSGVEWLGEVPAHWEVSPLMRLTAPGRAIMYGIVLPGPDMPDGIPIVKGGDVKPGRLRLDLLNRTTPEIEAPFARARLRPGDIVYSIRGSIGDAEPVPAELLDANMTQDAARISPSAAVNGRWLLHVMRSSPVFVQLEQRSLGAAIRGINIYDLKRAQIPVPPREEQDRIAAFLDAQTEQLAELSASALAASILLNERRSALISAAVTGKIDLGSSTVQQPLNRAQFRLIIGGAIIEATANQPGAGRTKQHKIVYLTEAHVGVGELQGTYLREAAGPLDRGMVEEMETRLKSAGHISVEQSGGSGTAVTYRVLCKRGAFRDQLRIALGAREPAFNRLINDLGDLDLKPVEAIATLYAVWNDALIDGDQPTDDAIISAFLSDWHPEKKEKFRADELHTWLGWMRRHGLVPVGQGPKTSTGRLFT